MSGVTNNSKIDNRFFCSLDNIAKGKVFHLPELVKEILKKLGVQDLANCCTVESKWKDYIQELISNRAKSKINSFFGKAILFTQKIEEERLLKVSEDIDGLGTSLQNKTLLLTQKNEENGLLKFFKEIHEVGIPLDKKTFSALVKVEKFLNVNISKQTNINKYHQAMVIALCASRLVKVALPICIEMTKMTSSFFEDQKEEDRESICIEIFKTLCENKLFDSAIKLARSFTHNHFKYLAFEQILIELCFIKDVSRVIELQNMVCLLNIKRKIHPDVIDLLCERELFDQAIGFMNQTNYHKSCLVKIIAIALCKKKLFDQAIDLIDKSIDKSIDAFDQIDEAIIKKRNSIERKYNIIEDICNNPDIEDVENLILKLINKISDVSTRKVEINHHSFRETNTIDAMSENTQKMYASFYEPLHIEMKDKLICMFIEKFCKKNKFYEAIEKALTISDGETRKVAFNFIQESVYNKPDNEIINTYDRDDILQYIDTILDKIEE